MAINIPTPPSVVMDIVTEGGMFKGKFEFNPGFGNKYTANFKRAQMFVDSEVIRFCSARVPFQTGMLQKSGITGTVIGSGEVKYTAPYAKRQYKTAPYRGYDANRGGEWFERGKAAEGKRILQGAMQIAAGGV